MKTGHDSGENGGTEGGSGNDLMQEVHQELDESRRSIRELMRYRQSFYHEDKKKMEAYMEKAREAINHLFTDELPAADSKDTD